MNKAFAFKMTEPNSKQLALDGRVRELLIMHRNDYARRTA